MTHKKLTLSLIVGAALVLMVTAYAEKPDKDNIGPYKFLKTIPIPTGLVGFDISWVDSAASRYYLANRGDATAKPPVAPTIDVINTEKLTLVEQIKLHTAGNGVVAIHKGGSDDEGEGNEKGTLVVGGADSTAIFIDLANTSNQFAVPTGGTMRADELAFDPVHKIILIANDRTVDDFVTFISTKGFPHGGEPPHVLGHIKYDGSVTGVPHANGIEQPVWDGRTKKFYLAIPDTFPASKGEVDEIDPVEMAVTRRFTTTCGPAGLVLIPGQRLMTSCGDVIDIKAGAVVHTVAKVGGDEIWFNHGDDRVYFGGGLDRISVPVVNALSPFDLITTLTVGKLAAPPEPAHTTHSVAADSENLRVFVPVTHEGIKVYTDATGDEDNDN